MSNVPEPYKPYATPPVEGVPAHHRPPNVFYDEQGRPVHFTIGQPPAPLVVQAPVQQGMEPALFRLIVITFLILAVVVVCTACVCAVVVLMGGTLMGIIGAVGQNLTMLTFSLVGAIVAAGWAASKIRPATRTERGRKRR
ncbi:hypothetical protein [Streptomyces canus]|uniref:hypothetical protein n=1 Tax=Streptomyces canus TaxID=58343 RepID=UPI000366271B|nr:hypothetical protein [Streptomyces canus]